MAHKEQKEFCMNVKRTFPQFFYDVDVCDVGSLDINGNNHYLFDNYTYIGIDIGRGKNVNVVSTAHEFRPINGKLFDVVITTEMLEHDRFWQKSLNNICQNLLRSGGLLIFTCATTGRIEHGTEKSTRGDSPLTSKLEDWSNYYMNLTEANIIEAIDIENYFKIWQFYVNNTTHDLYFWGIKK